MPPPGQLMLVFDHGPRHPKPRHIELSRLKKPELLCGRQEAGNAKPDIPLLGFHTSRRHCSLKVDNAGVHLRDLGASNGTYWVIGSDLQQIKSMTWHLWPPGQMVMFGADMQRNLHDSVKRGQADLATLRDLQTPVANIGPAVAAALPRVAAKGAAEAPIGPQLPGRAATSPGAPATNGRVIGPQRPPQAATAASAREEQRGAKRPLEQSKGPLKCDKCDKNHPTEQCPYFKKTREDHKDAWVNYGRQHPLTMGRTSEKCVKRGQVVPQPGDGSCLFHSLCHGLNGNRRGGNGAHSLRQDLMTFISKNPSLEIAGDTLEEWVKWDAQCTVATYTKKMRGSGWGGGIEMAACSILHKVNVHVYEGRRHGEFERISCFDAPKQTNRTIHVIYKGGMHFDALIVR